MYVIALRKLIVRNNAVCLNLPQIITYINNNNLHADLFLDLKTYCNINNKYTLNYLNDLHNYTSIQTTRI